MSQQKRSGWDKFIRIFTGGYNYLLGLFALLVILNGTGLISSSFAATQTVEEQATAGGFQATICIVFSLMGQIVGAVAVVMIIAAGVMYAGSGGSDKGVVGIGAAKNMIMSAIAGVALFLLGGLLLGDCSAADSLRYGDLIRNLLPSSGTEAPSQ